jgi:hypothetical protein
MFILRFVGNTQILSLAEVQSYIILNCVVLIVTIELYKS